MDKLSIIGLAVAIIAITLGYSLEGGMVSGLIDGPALIIVLGGTLGAVMLQSQLATFKKALGVFKWVFVPPFYDTQAGIEQIKSWPSTARQKGYLALEEQALVSEDPYAAKGLSLLIDGSHEQRLRDTLEIELMLERERLLDAARVYEAMGGYAPTIGILGAVLGLIQAMAYISEPDKLGAGVATAFLATIYGVGFANLLFLPVANKLKQAIEEKMLYHELIAEGIMAMQQGETPANIELKLEAYCAERHVSAGTNMMRIRHRRGHVKESQHTHRWLVSYADYMTIMFALFVVMYAIAINKKDEEFAIFSQTLEQFFDRATQVTQPILTEQQQSTGDGVLQQPLPVNENVLEGESIVKEPIRGSKLIPEQADVSLIEQKELGEPLETLLDKLTGTLLNEIRQGDAQLQLNENWLTIEMSSGLLFPSASATVTNRAEQVVARIAEIISPMRNYLRVRGYTMTAVSTTKCFAPIGSYQRPVQRP